MPPRKNLNDLRKVTPREDPMRADTEVAEPRKRKRVVQKHLRRKLVIVTCGRQ